MKTINTLAAAALLLAAGSSFAAVTDGQPDNAWLMHPASQTVQTPAPAPAPAPAASNDQSARTTRATAEDRDILMP